MWKQGLSALAQGGLRLLRRRWRALVISAAAVAILILILGGVLSYDSECGPAPPILSTAPLMKAAVHRCYGPPAVVKLEHIPRPVPAADQVLVRVRAAALNPLDLHLLRGTPYLIRLRTGLGAPADSQLGTDFAGTVAAVGKEVTRFKTGDAVFGAASGTLAEYVTMSESGAIAAKPPEVSFDEAASVPVAGVTALQALRDLGGVRAGDKVLINGASGGVGTFAVELARNFGAEVTGVCSTGNVQMVTALGARHVIDYTREDFTAGDARYNLILDMVGNHSPDELRGVLEPDGVAVMIGGPKGEWLGPVAAHIEAALGSPFASGRVVRLGADLRQDDLQTLSLLMQAGRLRPFVERINPLEQLPAALAFLETGHARGKVVIEIE